MYLQHISTVGKSKKKINLIIYSNVCSPISDVNFQNKLTLSIHIKNVNTENTFELKIFHF